MLLFQSILVELVLVSSILAREIIVNGALWAWAFSASLSPLGSSHLRSYLQSCSLHLPHIVWIKTIKSVLSASALSAPFSSWDLSLFGDVAFYSFSSMMHMRLVSSHDSSGPTELPQVLGRI